MTTLREELAEIIRWRFRSADGKPLNGPSVVQRAMEIADELAPFIEDAVGWDDAAVPAPEREAVRVLIALFDAMAEDWLTQADNIRLQRGQHTRVKDGHEVLAACAYTIKDKLAALRAEGEGER